MLSIAYFNVESTILAFFVLSIVYFIVESTRLAVSVLSTGSSVIYMYTVSSSRKIIDTPPAHLQAQEAEYQEQTQCLT